MRHVRRTLTLLGFLLAWQPESGHAGEAAPAPTSFAGPDRFVSQEPDGPGGRGLMPRLFVNCARDGRQVALCAKEPPRDFLAAIRELAGAPRDSAVVEWADGHGGEVREWWWLDRARGLLVCPDPATWYAQALARDRWSVRCKALGLAPEDATYDPQRLAASVEQLTQLSGFDIPRRVFGGWSHLLLVAGSADSSVALPDSLPVPVLRVPPADYPDEAKARGESGLVEVQALVDTDGTVAQVVVIRSHPVFDGVSTAAVREWKYVPAHERGRAVAVWVIVPVKFTLD